MATTSPPTPPRRSSRAAAPERRARAERLLALFAWHRDGPLVARSLGLSLDELHDQLDELKLRRKAYRLARGSDHELPIAKPVPGAPSGPPVRRRARAPRPEVPPEAVDQAPLPGAAEAPDAAVNAGSDPAEGPHRGAIAAQSAELLGVLAEVGPRRTALSVRLGGTGRPLPERVLLARFRAAGLERELGQRERDLLRGLFARHRGAARAVAVELGLDAEEVQRLVRERGLVQEIEALRERFRAQARRRRWPREQIEQLFRRRDWLDDLGIGEEMESEALSRARPAWERSGRSLDRLRRELRISEAEARALRDLLTRR
jgi:hypothetical protein